MKRINTDKAAKNFSDQLVKKNEISDEYQTFFLNGKWGAGKTTFLHNVNKIFGGEVKLEFLDVWSIEQTKNLNTNCYKLLKPGSYYLGYSIKIFATVLTVLLIGKVHFPLLNNIGSWCLKNSSKIFGDSITEWGFVLFQLLIAAIVIGSLVNEVNKYTFNSYATRWLDKLGFKNRILVIDDFDRLLPEQQYDVYRMLNHIQGKIPIIFVGDFDQLKTLEGNDEEDKSKFLAKLIDKRVDLPSVLHPTEIWKDYFYNLSKQMELETQLKEFKYLTIYENRNIRDQKQLSKYIDEKLLQDNQYESVVVEDQLLIIYLYLFHNSIYDKLMLGDFEEYENVTLPSFENQVAGQYKLNELIKTVIDKQMAYPYPFVQSKNTYMVQEEVSVLSEEEILSDFEDENTVRKIFIDGSINDYYYYLHDHFRLLSDRKKEIVNRVAFSLYKSNHLNDLIDLVISKNIYKKAGETNRKSFNRLKKLLLKYDFDLSEIVRLLHRRHMGFSYRVLGELLSDQIDDIFHNLLENQYRCPCYLLMTYLSNEGLYAKFDDWTSEIYTVISILSPDEFVYFAEYQTLISKKGQYIDSSDNGQITINADKQWFRVFSLRKAFGDWNDQSQIQQSLDNKFHEAEMNGYSFEKGSLDMIGN